MVDKISGATPICTTYKVKKIVTEAKNDKTPVVTPPDVFVKDKNNIQTGDTINFQTQSSKSSELDYTGNISCSTWRSLGLWDNLKGTITKRWFSAFGKDSNYKPVTDAGINYKNSNEKDIVLAQYGQKVASSLRTEGNCYTGVKHALLSSGVLDDYGAMPKGSAKNAVDYFDSHPEKFEKVEAKTTEDLKKLPAGYIVVYKNDEPKRHGHIAITNGNGQEYSDHTGNMNWNEEHKGEHHVYKLTDGWKYDSQTKKLKFENPKKIKQKQ